MFSLLSVSTRGSSMPAQPNEPENEKFVPGQHYKFDPPVETNCISVVPGSTWAYRSFAEGWCLKYDERTGGFVFQGKPEGQQTEHYFIVEWGKGSVAKNIPRATLRVVK
jgi:hypothetical protein